MQAWNDKRKRGEEKKRTRARKVEWMGGGEGKRTEEVGQKRKGGERNERREIEKGGNREGEARERKRRRKRRKREEQRDTAGKHT